MFSYFQQFLSMKLATVNPRMEFNIEGLLTKDVREHTPKKHTHFLIHLDRYLMFMRSLWLTKIHSNSSQIIHSRAGPSSSIGFPPDMAMPYPPLHPSQPVLNQAGHAGMGNSSDALRRTINSHFNEMSAGFKEPTSQVTSRQFLISLTPSIPNYEPTIPFWDVPN